MEHARVDAAVDDVDAAAVEAVAAGDDVGGARTAGHDGVGVSQRESLQKPADLVQVAAPLGPAHVLHEHRHRAVNLHHDRRPVPAGAVELIRKALAPKLGEVEDVEPLPFHKVVERPGHGERVADEPEGFSVDRELVTRRVQPMHGDPVVGFAAQLGPIVRGAGKHVHLVPQPGEPPGLHPGLRAHAPPAGFGGVFERDETDPHGRKIPDGGRPPSAASLLFSEGCRWRPVAAADPVVLSA